VVNDFEDSITQLPPPMQQPYICTLQTAMDDMPRDITAGGSGAGAQPAAPAVSQWSSLGCADAVVGGAE